VTEAACWAHARRKFVDLHDLHQSPVAAEALDRIGALYAVEAEIRAALPTSDVRYARNAAVRFSMRCTAGLSRPSPHFHRSRRQPKLSATR
jgi:hypothetical protein